MAIDFRNVTLAPLEDFTASAPDGAIIGIVGENSSGVRELSYCEWDGAAERRRGQWTGDHNRSRVCIF